MEGLIIGTITLEKLPQVVELHRTILPFEFNLEQAQARLPGLMEREDYRIFCASQGDEVLGTVTAICCKALSGNFLVLEDFVVKPGRTGKGIGGKIMEAVDAFAKEQNCGYAILVSSGFRTDAHRFYYNHGFTDDVKGFRKVY